MKLNLEATIDDLNGKPLIAKNKQQVTLKDVCINALMTPIEADKRMEGIEKAKLFALGLAITGGKDDLVVEEIALIKDRIGKLYSQLYVGRAYELIED